MYLQLTHETGYLISINNEKISQIEKDSETGKGIIVLDNKQIIPVAETYEEVITLINL